MSLTVGGALVVIGAVGLLDAVIGDVWDLAVLFGAVTAIGVVGLVTRAGRRRPVTLRADLATRLDTRARRSGVPFDQLLDRSVAGQLQSMEDPPSTAQ